jgi:hypothetical protein
LVTFLKEHADAYNPLPDGTKVSLFCKKISDTVQGKPASDVGTIQECSVFLDFPVDIAMTKVPTKRFSFRCTRPIESQRPRQDSIVVMMTQRSTRFVHLPPPFANNSIKTARDILYNDLRKYLEDEEVGFQADHVDSLGTEFLKHLTYALFPLSHAVWRALNDKHNRGGPTPDPEFVVFFGRKILGHKADKPSVTTIVQHLQNLWIGMGIVKIKGTWPSIFLKITNLSLQIQKYYQRFYSQAERQLNLISSAQPARTLENASNVANIEPLPLSKNMCDHLITMNIAMMDKDVYIRMYLNPFVDGFLRWQRCASHLVYWPRMLLLVLRILLLLMLLLLLLLSSLLLLL